MITRPEDFEYGVWRVNAWLEPEEMNAVGNDRFIFELPALPERFFRIDAPYKTPAPAGSAYPFQGEFISGEWRGIVQANGVPEDMCETRLAQVEFSLRQSIEAQLERFDA